MAGMRSPGGLRIARESLLALAIVAATGPLQAQPPWKGERGMGPGRPAAGREHDAIAPSGLQPLFPESARCPEIASPYASQTRYDGSLRPKWSFGGYHGGIDITLAEGTPLLALAAGTVVAKGEGGMLEGTYLWLRHAPGQTGLPYWLYSKYQHLESVPDTDIGARVSMGEPVARSGKTGTAGRHYGPSGYPHLHLTTRKASSGDASVGPGAAPPLGATLFDPLAVYADARGKTGEGLVPIPYKGIDGKIAPPNTRVVWPVACAAR